jgi:cytochrome c oxidase assembly protein subunit 15
LDIFKSIWLVKLTAPKRLRLYVWLSLATQILIVVTGGLVRLTASGLGCPTWPKCTDESLVSTPEMGIHGIIEFGNRLLTFVLLVIALLTFATIYRMHSAKRKLVLPTVLFFSSVIALVLSLAALVAYGLVWPVIALFVAVFVAVVGTTIWFIQTANCKEPRGILVPSFGLGLGIIAQAVVGGITVLTELNSWVVGLHFLISSYLIALATLLVFRALPKQMGEVSPLNRALRWPIAAVSVVTIVIGVVVTGAGPHAGDIDTPRNGLDLEVWQHYHSYPGYLMAALILIALVAQARVSTAWSSYPFRALVILALVTASQATLGVVQARMGVPALLVGLHMLGAAVLCSLVMFHWLSARAKK